MPSIATLRSLPQVVCRWKTSCSSSTVSSVFLSSFSPTELGPDGRQRKTTAGTLAVHLRVVTESHMSHMSDLTSIPECGFPTWKCWILCSKWSYWKAIVSGSEMAHEVFRFLRRSIYLKGNVVVVVEDLQSLQDYTSFTAVNVSFLNMADTVIRDFIHWYCSEILVVFLECIFFG